MADLEDGGYTLTTDSNISLFVTARKEVGARLYFHRRVWFCSQGGSTWQVPSPWADTPHPGRHTYFPPLGRHPTPPGQVHPPGRHAPWQTPPAGTPPPRQVHPPAGTHTPTPPAYMPPPSRYPPAGTPPGLSTPPPPGLSTPPRDTVNARAVSILLECNLVILCGFGVKLTK